MTDTLYLEYMTKISNLKEEGIIEKISYKRLAYESVDDRSHSILGCISKISGKQNSSTNGLIDSFFNVQYESETPFCL